MFKADLTQEEYNADMAAARRDGIKNATSPLDAEIAALKIEAAKLSAVEAQLTALTGERDSLKTSNETLTKQSAAASKNADAIKALAAAGVKPERIEKMLKFVPDDADFTDAAKSTATIESMKADLPEWFGVSQPAGAGAPPNSKPNGSGGSPNPPGDTNYAEQIAAALKSGDAGKSMALKRMAAEAAAKTK